MITLYQFATSPFCEKARRMLNFKGLDYALVEVDRARVADYKAVSPLGKFPAIDHDGVATWDSTNIAHYLEKTFPDPSLFPADPRERALAHVLEDWADESLYFYEITMRLAWGHNLDRALPEFAAGMPGVPLDILKTKIMEAAQQGVSVQGLGRKSPDDVVADVGRHFDALEAMLEASDWLVGGRAGLADIAVACQVRALAYAQEAEALLQKLPRIQGWLARLDEVASPTAPKAEAA